MGAMQYADGTERYEGDWSYDMPSGPGMKTHSDGSKYAGQFSAGMRSGAGECEPSRFDITMTSRISRAIAAISGLTGLSAPPLRSGDGVVVTRQRQSRDAEEELGEVARGPERCADALNRTYSII